MLRISLGNHDSEHAVGPFSARLSDSRHGWLAYAYGRSKIAALWNLAPCLPSALRVHVSR